MKNSRLIVTALCILFLSGCASLHNSLLGDAEIPTIGSSTFEVAITTRAILTYSACAAVETSTDEIHTITPCADN